MKSILTFLLAMGITVTLGDAYCWRKTNNALKAQKGCMVNGKLYPFGHIERTEDCHRCDCDKDGMQCCALFHTPVAFNKKKCKVIFNKESCDYDVVQKDDPSKECFVYARVG